MKKLARTLLLLLPVTVLASGSGSYQQIEAVVDGKQVELTANSLSVLALGDYPARISPSFRAPSFHPTDAPASTPPPRIPGIRDTI